MARPRSWWAADDRGEPGGRFSAALSGEKYPLPVAPGATRCSSSRDQGGYGVYIAVAMAGLEPA